MTSWWNNNVEKRINDFKSWVCDFNHPAKVHCRKYVAEQKYKSILDCGCGIATEYYGYKNDSYDIKYTGLDSCKFFVEKNLKDGITMIESELENDLPIKQKTYDVVYCREVLEHLSYYEKTLSELIRVAKKEVIVGFFIKPTEDDDNISYWEEEDLYHNKYNLSKLESFIKSNPRFDSLFWEEVEKESILHIKLK
jgi:ubiquinone/menaquinone biosynthesis C-methylase UbiE